MSMNAEALETVIADRIRGLSIPARPFSQPPASDVPADSPGEIVVKYAGTNYSAREVSGVQRVRCQMFRLIATGAELGGENGVYAWLDRVRVELEGRVFPDAGGPLELEAEVCMGGCDGGWVFEQKWNLNSKLNYEKEDDYADRPLSVGNP